MESSYSDYEASIGGLDPSEPIDIVKAVSELKIIYEQLKNNFDTYSYVEYNHIRKDLIRRINFNIIQNRNNPEIFNKYAKLLSYVIALDLDKIVCKKNNSCNILSTKRKSLKSKVGKSRKPKASSTGVKTRKTRKTRKSMKSKIRKSRKVKVGKSSKRKSRKILRS